MHCLKQPCELGISLQYKQLALFVQEYISSLDVDFIRLSIPDFVHSKIWNRKAGFEANTCMCIHIIMLSHMYTHTHTHTHTHTLGIYFHDPYFELCT